MKEQVDLIKCKNCNEEFQLPVKFCSRCGSKVNVEKDLSTYLTKSLIFYFVNILYLIGVYITMPQKSQFLYELFIEMTFAIIVFIFMLMDLRKIIDLFIIKKIPYKIIGFTLIFPIISSLIVHFSMNEINIFLFDDKYNCYQKYSEFDYPIFWSVIFISVTPAVFEEIGFRGFLYNQLINVSSPWVTICLTSFLFALIHLSFISFLWIFPFGIVLGYIRYRFKVIWLGMIIHFLHNLFILYLDYLHYNNIGFNSL
ncbi:MAG: CPBP family intramembrane metalloprotease [Flavobacteriales bacterium]|nr:CPBP family intramembrane metalloprotease [Flavobacteriales bacterium]